MKRTNAFFSGLLALLVLCAAGQAEAETVTFMGKSYCPIKYEITWPFVQRKAAPEQGSGITANIYELPKEKAEEKSASEQGSDMDRLRILAAQLKIGQHVTEDQVLVTYEMPLENLIKQKEALSRAKVGALEKSLGWVNYLLAAQRQSQEDLENQAANKSVAPNIVSLAQKDLEALLLQQASLTEQLELAKARHHDAVIIAQSKYGKDVDLNHLPREGYIRSPMDGYVLWLNSRLLPGMAFTKKATLIAIGRLSPIIIRSAVHEIAVQKLKVGDPATVVFHAMRSEPFKTTISKVSFVAQPAMMQQPSFYEIELTLPNKDLRIKEGMRCDVTVELPAGAK